MKNTLLGKKRETREDDENNEYHEYRMTKEEKESCKKKAEFNEENDSESSVISESYSEDLYEKEQPSEKAKNENTQPRSIFGNPNEQKHFTGGLFGDLSKKSNSLFGDTLLENKFEAGSLFCSAQPLFSSSDSSKSSTIFPDKKPLFSFNSNNTDNKFPNFLFTKGETKEDEGEGNDEEDGNELLQSNSPNPYNPTEKPSQLKEQSIYKKKYVKSIENCLVFSKSEGKFSSRGNGFLSLETAEVDGKRVSVVVLRNTLGNKIIEGFLNSKVNTFSSYIKNFKYVACFSFIQKVNNKHEIGNAKVPFQSDADLKEFEKEYKAAIEFITTNTKEIKKEEKEEVKTVEQNIIETSMKPNGTNITNI